MGDDDLITFLPPVITYYVCTAGHVEHHVEHLGHLRWCPRREPAFGHSMYQVCNERSRQLKDHELAAYLVGGEEALVYTIKKCTRCGLGESAWCHSTGASRSEWHPFEWDRTTGSP